MSETHLRQVSCVTPDIGPPAYLGPQRIAAVPRRLTSTCRQRDARRFRQVTGPTAHAGAVVVRSFSRASSRAECTPLMQGHRRFADRVSSSCDWPSPR